MKMAGVILFAATAALALGSMLLPAGVADRAVGLGFALWQLILLALLGRLRPGWPLAQLRLVSLVSGAGVAVGVAGVSGLTGEALQTRFFAALLGLAAVVFLMRLMPAAVLGRWLGRPAVMGG
jgi:hypothetical protein